MFQISTAYCLRTLTSLQKSGPIVYLLIPYYILISMHTLELHETLRKKVTEVQKASKMSIKIKLKGAGAIA